VSPQVILDGLLSVFLERPVALQSTALCLLVDSQSGGETSQVSRHISQLQSLVTGPKRKQPEQQIRVGKGLSKEEWKGEAATALEGLKSRVSVPDKRSSQCRV
jgi:hypothetical protein